MKKIYIASLMVFWGLFSYVMENTLQSMQTHATTTDQMLYSLRDTVLALENSYRTAFQKEAQRDALLRQLLEGQRKLDKKLDTISKQVQKQTQKANDWKKLVGQLAKNQAQVDAKVSRLNVIMSQLNVGINITMVPLLTKLVQHLEISTAATHERILVVSQEIAALEQSLLRRIAEMESQLPAPQVNEFQLSSTIDCDAALGFAVLGNIRAY